MRNVLVICWDCRDRGCMVCSWAFAREVLRVCRPPPNPSAALWVNVPLLSHNVLSDLTYSLAIPDRQELIDCNGASSAPAYGLDWIAAHGIDKIADAPLANHSDPNITGCRGITNCTHALARTFAHISGVQGLKNHDEPTILALLQRGPLAVSIAAEQYNGSVGSCS